MNKVVLILGFVVVVTLGLSMFMKLQPAVPTEDLISSTSPLLSSVPVTRKQPNSDFPASGICSEKVSGVEVLVIIGADNIPQPRCIKMSKEQKIKISNNSSQNFILNFADFKVTIKPQQGYLLDKPVGDYLLPGAHLGAGAEIWLVN